MPFLAWSNKCASTAADLTYLLTSDEYEDVYGEIAQFSFAQWKAWRETRLTEIESLVFATPAKRRKFLAALPRKDKVRLVFAACQYCHEGHDLFFAIFRYCKPDLPDRVLGLAAHAVLREVKAGNHSYWPWRGTPTYTDFRLETDEDE